MVDWKRIKRDLFGATLGAIIFFGIFPRFFPGFPEFLAFVLTGFLGAFLGEFFVRGKQ